jgi:hypothetical protein
MSDWIPKLNGAVDLKALPLTPEEGFVLSRLDGVTPASHLPALTGLPAERLNVILRKLYAQGVMVAVPLPAAKPAPPARPPVEPEPPVLEASAEDIAPSERSEAPAPSEAEGTSEPAEQESTEQEPTEQEPAESESEADVAAAGNYRQIFELHLHPLTQDERTARAHTAEDPELSAFCFDPLPAVIKAVLENPRVGLAHARLIVRHHRNPQGLEALCARAAFAADVGVRRWLVRNPQLPAGLFRRLWGTRRMLEQHKLSMDRDVPEPTRRTARELMRQRFANGPSEEKAELIFNTEGRALAALSGLPVDGKTASILCGRTYRSSMLIQNIARWSAAPPALIAHLLRQEMVRRQPMLRTLLARHPNAPADAKRGV